MRGDAVNCEEIVVYDLGFVSGEFHFLDAPIEWHIRVLNELESVVFGLGFVVGVDICESRACFCESTEVFGEGDMREIAFEVRLVFFAIIRVMQESVVVVEDVPFGDGVVLVVGSELRQCPIGDVFAAVCAVFVVGVEGGKDCVPDS